MVRVGNFPYKEIKLPGNNDAINSRESGFREIESSEREKFKHHPDSWTLKCLLFPKAFFS